MAGCARRHHRTRPDRSVDAAQASDPLGLALPALRLAAVLDPAGHPDNLWDSPAITDYLRTRRTPPTGTDQVPGAGAVSPATARAAVRLLHRYSLATHDGP